MTVAELIKQLQELPQDHQVICLRSHAKPVPVRALGVSRHWGPRPVVEIRS